MSKAWHLIWHGNETYPFPLSIHTADGSEWVARDGTVSKIEHAHLIAAAPETAAERDRLREINAELLEALANSERYAKIGAAAKLVSAKHRALGLIIEETRAAIARAKGETP